MCPADDSSISASVRVSSEETGIEMCPADDSSIFFCFEHSTNVLQRLISIVCIHVR